MCKSNERSFHENTFFLTQRNNKAVISTESMYTKLYYKHTQRERERKPSTFLQQSIPQTDNTIDSTGFFYGDSLNNHCRVLFLIHKYIY